MISKVYLYRLNFVGHNYYELALVTVAQCVSGELLSIEAPIIIMHEGPEWSPCHAHAYYIY